MNEYTQKSSDGFDETVRPESDSCPTQEGPVTQTGPRVPEDLPAPEPHRDEATETPEFTAGDAGFDAGWQSPQEPESQESGTGESSPFVSLDEARRMGQEEAWRQSFQSEPRVREPKRKSKKTKTGRTTGKMVAAAVAFALVGSAVGGVVAGAISNRKWEARTSQLQEQIDALSGTGSSGVIHGVSSPIVYEPAADGMLTPAQVYQQSVDSVVSVTTTGTTTNGWTTSQFTSSGSGFILTADGYVLTNYHVIEGYTTVSVTTVEEQTYEAQVVGYDSFSDVALLKVEAENLPAVTIGDSDVVNVGDQVAAIGNPLGELASSQTVGYISAKNRLVSTDGSTLNMLQTDAAINSGNSGGPLFNMLGQVIGITTAKYSGNSSSGASIEGIGFAIPINSVMNLVEDLMEYGYVNQPYLGVQLQDMDASVAKAYGLPSGPRVEVVEDGFCAQKAGVQVGDIITGLGDHNIESYSELVLALRDFRAGDTTTISIYRAGAELKLDITLDEKPEGVTVGKQESQQGSQTPQESPDQSDDYGFGFPWDFFEQFP